jgi:hypothetical protein
MPVNPIIPLLPLSVCSGPRREATTSGSGPDRSSRRRASSIEPEKGVVQDGEVFPCVLEVDTDELRGDLELHQRSGGVPPGLTIR